MDHPLIKHKIAIIRRKETGSKLFREMISEIAMTLKPMPSEDACAI